MYFFKVRSGLVFVVHLFQSVCVGCFPCFFFVKRTIPGVRPHSFRTYDSRFHRSPRTQIVTFYIFVIMKVQLFLGVPAASTFSSQGHIMKRMASSYANETNNITILVFVCIHRRILQHTLKKEKRVTLDIICLNLKTMNH